MSLLGSILFIAYYTADWVDLPFIQDYVLSYRILIGLYAFTVVASFTVKDIFLALRKVTIDEKGLSIEFLLKDPLHIEYERIKDILPSGGLGRPGISFSLWNMSIDDLFFNSLFIKLPKHLLDAHADCKLAEMRKEETL